MAKHQTFLATDLSQAIGGDASCIFFDTARYQSEVAEIGSWIRHSIGARKIKICEIKGRKVSESELLEQLKVQLNADNDLDETLSAYRQMVNLADRGDAAVIAVYRANLLSPEGIHILARLARYLKRSHSQWQILLFANGSRFEEFDLFQLPIDLSFKNETKSIKSKVSDSTPIKAGNRATPWLTIASLLALAVVATVIFLLNSGSNQEADQVTTQASRSVVEYDPTSAPPLKQNNTASDVESSTWLSDDEFNAIIAKMSEPDGSKSRSSQTVSKTSANKSSSVNLSTEMAAALKSGNLERVMQLRATGENLNSTGAEQQTPLIIASINGHQPLVTYLLKHQASLNVGDELGHTALYYAAVHGHAGIAKQLMTYGAKINQRNNLDKTPLMAAVHNGHTDIAQLLLNQKAKIDVQDHSGWTALFYAVWNNNEQMVSLLLKYRPNLSLSDNSGNTIEALARARKNKTILSLLKLS